MGIGSSKAINRAAWTIALIIIFTFVAYIFDDVCRPLWDYDHLEKNAYKAITGPELQAWATNLLASFTNDTGLRLSELGTNFPAGLRQIAPPILGPHIYIHATDTNESAYVQAWWGSGFLGAAGFCVGPTNFVYGGIGDLTNGVFINDGYYYHLWQPGVWFYRSP